MRAQFLLGLGLAAVMALPAAAAPRIYAYSTSANYCPAGLQPISINGVICCGQPNQSMTYQQAMAHPVARRAYRPAPAPKPDCPIGQKSCR